MATSTMHPQTLSCRTLPRSAFPCPVTPVRVVVAMSRRQRQSGYGGSSWWGSGKGSGSSSQQWWGAQGVGNGSGDWWEAEGGSQDWWRDPKDDDDGASDWWRDPKDEVQEAAEAAENIADDQYKNARRGAIEEHGLPVAKAAFFGGKRKGHCVDKFPRHGGQQRGTSGAKHEKFATHDVFTVNIPVSIKEAGYWWTELKQHAIDNGLKISFRPMRYNKEGPGWNSLNVTGPGGASFIEDALKMLMGWRPDFDIEAVQLPELSSDFPIQEVRDAYGNVKEKVLVPGVTLVSVDQLSVRVVGYGCSSFTKSAPVLILRDRRKRRKHDRHKVMLHSTSSEEEEEEEESHRGASSSHDAAGVTETYASDHEMRAEEDSSMRSMSEEKEETDSRMDGSSISKEEESSGAAAGVVVTASTGSSGAAAGVGVTTPPTEPSRPFPQATPSGVQIKKIEFKNKAPKIPVTKLNPQTMSVSGCRHPEDLPPFYHISLAEVEALRSQQKLTTNLGVERVKLFNFPELPYSDVRVAFCTTAFKRPTVSRALKINMSLTWQRRQQITWHVVDFNPDTNLTTDLLETLEAAVKEKHLKLYRADGMEYWHCCVAKNTAHMVADESFDVLVNVDGDNLLTLEFVEQCLEIAHRMKSGSVALAQFYGSGEAGTYGRIMIRRSLFHLLGGYDESFHPVGCQDTDLIYRVLMCDGVGETIRVDTNSMVGTSIDNRPGATWSQCIQEKVANTDPAKYGKWKFGFMDQANRSKMYLLLEAGEVQRNVDKTIGLPATLLQFSREKKREEEAEEDEEGANYDEADFGGDRDDSNEEDDAGDETPKGGNGDGGVTPKHADAEGVPDSVPPPPKRFEFKIVTFGVEKLAQQHRWCNKAANDLYA